MLKGNLMRLRRLINCYGLRGVGYLLPGRFYLDFVEIPITTKCNLLCSKCANLMPKYQNPHNIDPDLVLESIRKIDECIDACGNFRLLGGEPFLHPDLATFIAAIPAEKCRRVSIPTNATVIPDNPKLYEQLRRSNAVIVISNYPVAKEQQIAFVQKLEEEGVAYEVSHDGDWIDYGEPVRREVSARDLQRQFANCNLRSKSVLNGVMYYCPRHAHGFDLGLMDRRPGEYVEILSNDKMENRKQIRRLMWRGRYVEACSYCLRGTEDAISASRGN